MGHRQLKQLRPVSLTGREGHRPQDAGAGFFLLGISPAPLWGILVAVVDASLLKAENGTQSVPVSIIIPSTGSAWVLGSYTVNVEVTRQ